MANSPEIGQQSRLTRREFLISLGVIGGGFLISDLEKRARAIEKSFSPFRERVFCSPEEVLNALWDGRINPTWLEIKGYAAGQIQVLEWDSQQEAWEEELSPTFAWIHRYPENPRAARGLFLIHRREFLQVEKALGKIKEGTEVKIYAGWEHSPGSEILVAQVRGYQIVEAEEFDSPTDLLFQEAATNPGQIAIVTCHPPTSQQPNPPQRLIYFCDIVWPSKIKRRFPPKTPL